MAYDLESRRGLLGAQQKIDALKEYAGEENMTLEHPTCVQQTLVDSPQRNLISAQPLMFYVKTKLGTTTVHTSQR